MSFDFRPFNAAFTSEQLLWWEPMKDHTTFKIGGPADLMVIPHRREEIVRAIQISKEQGIPSYVIGNGSNLLVKDGGIRGVVIKISKSMNSSCFTGNLVTAEVGISLGELANAALDRELGGLEFASGIPGTLGGAVFMNAGAYGGEMKDVIRSVDYLDKELNIRTAPAEEMEFGYRTSRIQKEGLIALSCTMELSHRERLEIKSTMDDLNGRRRDKQPLELPSGGSTFRRPEGFFAGKLIMDSGLRGYTIGGAQVSEKHCGFVVNRGGATAEDVIKLIDHVQRVVNEKFGVCLLPEIRIIGE